MLAQIFTDGATVGHNKLGKTKEIGIGIYCANPQINIAEKYSGKSNNEAEFKALIRAMEEAIRLNLKDVHFFSDSKIIVNRAATSLNLLGSPYYRPRGKRRNIRMDRFQDQVIELRLQFNTVKFYWIPREQNEKADELSKIALGKII